MEFYHKRQSEREQSEILAFHDTRAKSFKERGENLADIVAKVPGWQVAAIPGAA